MNLFRSCDINKLAIKIFLICISFYGILKKNRNERGCIMAGLFTLIWGAAVGASAIKHAVTNSWCKNNLKHSLPNGVKYYIDADGKHRLLDGTVIMWKGYGDREKVIEVKTNKVVYDRGAEIDRENQKHELKAKQKSLEDGNLLYIKRNKRCHNLPCLFEFATNKQLAEIAKFTNYKTKEVEYRKWYFFDYLREKYPDMDLSCAVCIPHDTTKPGDKGIIITEEEFKRIKEEYLKLRLEEGVYEWSAHLRISDKAMVD